MATNSPAESQLEAAATSMCPKVRSTRRCIGWSRRGWCRASGRTATVDDVASTSEQPPVGGTSPRGSRRGKPSWSRSIACWGWPRDRAVHGRSRSGALRAGAHTQTLPLRVPRPSDRPCERRRPRRCCGRVRSSGHSCGVVRRRSRHKSLCSRSLAGGCRDRFRSWIYARVDPLRRCHSPGGSPMGDRVFRVRPGVGRGDGDRIDPGDEYPPPCRVARRLDAAVPPNRDRTGIGGRNDVGGGRRAPRARRSSRIACRSGARDRCRWRFVARVVAHSTARGRTFPRRPLSVRGSAVIDQTSSADPRANCCCDDRRGGRVRARSRRARNHAWWILARGRNRGRFGGCRLPGPTSAPRLANRHDRNGLTFDGCGHERFRLFRLCGRLVQIFRTFYCGDRKLCDRGST